MGQNSKRQKRGDQLAKFHKTIASYLCEFDASKSGKNENFSDYGGKYVHKKQSVTQS